MVVYENGQGSHTRAAAVADVVPTSQARQGWPASGLNHPTSQSTHSSPSASVPGSHGEQSERSAFEIEPRPHSVHSDAPPPAAVPALHGIQLAAPAGEKVPASHAKHSTLPGSGAALPDWHVKHWSEPEACA